MRDKGLGEFALNEDEHLEYKDHSSLRNITFKPALHPKPRHIREFENKAKFAVRTYD